MSPEFSTIETRPLVSLALAVAALFVGAWTLVPAPTYAFLTLSVGAPELSGWLVVVALVAGLLVVRDVRRPRRVARLAAALSVAALVFPVLVLARIPATVREFDRAMEASLGADYLRAVAPAAIERMRDRPVAAWDLFRGLPAVSVRVSRDVPFAAPEGVPLTLDVYRPSSDDPAPAILQVYGGAWQRGAPEDNTDFARALSSAGYVVFAIDYRHAPRWRWPAQLDDVRAALVWIRDHGAEFGADASRIGVIGRSSGSQLAMIAATTPGAPPVRAVVGYYGPVDLTDAYRNPPVPDTLNLRKIQEDLFGGTPDDRPDAYRDASPITGADRPHPPTLIIDGGRDHIVTARAGTRLHDRLRRSGTSVLLVIPWADHSFDTVSFGPSAQLALYYTERFLAWALR